MLKVIDVSKWQGEINWEKVKGSIDGVIIRCGYGKDEPTQDDKQFKKNADECTRLGIPFGIYLYSYAKTLDAAKSEAAHALRCAKGYKLDFPIYLDLEESGTEEGAVERAIEFGNIIEKAGYWCGIYANQYWFQTVLKTNLDRFTKWVAKYSKNKPDVPGGVYAAWQYTSKGKIDGIDSYIDMSEFYKDFPKIINPTPTPVAPVVATAPIPVPAPAPVTPAPIPAPIKTANVTKTYTVVKGDTLWGIAVKLYGSGSKYTKIKELNGLKSDIIKAGQVLIYDTSVEYTAPAPLPEPKPSYVNYTVVKGDTLWGIAVKILGNGNRYKEIKNLNGLKSDTIKVGQVLKIVK